LQTDYIGLVLGDIWDEITPVERHAGLDDSFTGKGSLCRHPRTLLPGGSPGKYSGRSFGAGHSFVGLQIEYSLIERTVDARTDSHGKALNLGVLAWSPLARGVLTGKFTVEARPTEGGDQ